MIHETRLFDEEPGDLMTRLADVALKALQAAPEWQEGMKVIVFLDAPAPEIGPSTNKSGIGINGFDGTGEAIATLIIHLEAMFEANGQTLAIIPVEGMGHG